MENTTITCDGCGATKPKDRDVSAWLSLNKTAKNGTEVIRPGWNHFCSEACLAKTLQPAKPNA